MINLLVDIRSIYTTMMPFCDTRRRQPSFSLRTPSWPVTLSATLSYSLPRIFHKNLRVLLKVEIFKSSKHVENAGGVSLSKRDEEVRKLTTYIAERGESQDRKLADSCWQAIESHLSPSIKPELKVLVISSTNWRERVISGRDKRQVSLWTQQIKTGGRRQSTSQAPNKGQYSSDHHLSCLPLPWLIYSFLTVGARAPCFHLVIASGSPVSSIALFHQSSQQLPSPGARLQSSRSDARPWSKMHYNFFSLWAKGISKAVEKTIKNGKLSKDVH